MQPEPQPPARDRIKLVDPSVRGQSHLLVNLGFIDLCLRIFEHVDVTAEESHCRALAAYGAARDARVTFRPYHDGRELRRVLSGDLDGHTPTVFLNLEYSLFCWVRAVRPRGRSTWVLHSHFADPGTAPLSSGAKRVLRALVLFRFGGRARFIVYGDRIRANLRELLGPLVRPWQLAGVLHPIGLAPLPRTTAGDRARGIRIAFFNGWHPLPADVRATLREVTAIAESSSAVSLTVIGEAATPKPDRERVHSSDYRERLMQASDADVVLYLPTNDYSLQASGALMDSFVSGIPLVGLTTDFQQEVESLVGPIGFFFTGREELLRFVRSLGDVVRAREEIAVRRANLARGHRTVGDHAEVQLRRLLSNDPVRPRVRGGRR